MPVTAPDRHRSTLAVQLGGFAAAVVAFFAAFEPNLTIRYGPLVASFAIISTRPLSMRLGATEVWLTALVGWAGLSWLWSWYPEEYETRFIALVAFAIIFLAIRSATRWATNAWVVLGGYLVGCSVGLARTSLDLFGSSTAIRDRFMRITQVDDLNVNYVAYGAVFAVLSCVLILMTSLGNDLARRSRLILWVAVCFLTVGIVTTGTRGAILGLACLAIWILVTRVAVPFWPLTASAVGLLVLTSSGLVDNLIGNLDLGNRDEAGLSGRLPLWAAARTAWADSPFLGIGLGGTRQLNSLHLPTHNMLLENGATLGLAGLFLLVAFLLAALTDRISALSQDEKHVRLGAVIITLLPIAMSSGWDATATGWVAVAILSQPIGTLVNRPGPGRPKSSPLISQKRACHRKAPRVEAGTYDDHVTTKINTSEAHSARW